MEDRPLYTGVAKPELKALKHWIMSGERYIISTSDKKKLLTGSIVGLVLVVAGILILAVGGHQETDVEGAHAFHWLQRVYVNLWLDNVYFTGIALTGVLFLAIQYAAQAGWSAYIKRIPEAMGGWFIWGAVLTVALFFITNFTLPHFHIFHWLDHSLVEKGNPNYDAVIAGKSTYLNQGFFVVRMIIYYILWIGMFWLLRRESIAEDRDGLTSHWKKMRTYSALFIIFFAVTSSMAAWDWVMSIDPHWYSTLFGWYNFSSWFVAAMAFITWLIIMLYERGYLQQLNDSILHDMGKYLFAFSIFWAYLWISQFLLIYYANIPEESVYFVERLKSGQYAWIFYLNIGVNFVVPFFVLMPRDMKREKTILKYMSLVIFAGHWFDFYLMVIPGSLKENGYVGLMEIGFLILFTMVFIYVVLRTLSKARLVAHNHPMLEESLHHHI